MSKNDSKKMVAVDEESYKALQAISEADGCNDIGKTAGRIVEASAGV